MIMLVDFVKICGGDETQIQNTKADKVKKTEKGKSKINSRQSDREMKNQRAIFTWKTK